LMSPHLHFSKIFIILQPISFFIQNLLN